MEIIVILAILYGYIIIQEESKWENNKWTDLLNSGN